MDNALAQASRGLGLPPPEGALHVASVLLHGPLVLLHGALVLLLGTLLLLQGASLSLRVLLLRASVLLLGALLLLGLLLREASLLLPEESLQLSLQLGLVLREKSLLQGSLLREDGLVARADRVVVVGVLVVVRAVARAVEVVVLRVLRVLEAALLFLRGEALGLGGLLRGDALGLLLLLAVADGLADRDHGLLEQLLLEILVVELGLEVDGVLCKLVLGRQTLGLGGGFAGGFDLFRGFDLGAFGVRHVDDRVERIDGRVLREF